MKKLPLICLLVILVPVFGCAMHQKKVEHSLENPAPVNCSTAEGDIRVLEGEKVHVAARILEGITAITPAGAAIGILTWTEPTKFRVATGKYNEMLEERIALIQSTCNIEPSPSS